MDYSSIKEWIELERQECSKEDYQYLALLDCVEEVVKLSEKGEISSSAAEKILGKIEKIENENQPPIGFIVPVELTFYDE